MTRAYAPISAPKNNRAGTSAGGGFRDWGSTVSETVPEAQVAPDAAQDAAPDAASDAFQSHEWAVICKRDADREAFRARQMVRRTHRDGLSGKRGHAF